MRSTKEVVAHMEAFIEKSLDSPAMFFGNPTAMLHSIDLTLSFCWYARGLEEDEMPKFWAFADYCGAKSGNRFLPPDKITPEFSQKVREWVEMHGPPVLERLAEAADEQPRADWNYWDRPEDEEYPGADEDCISQAKDQWR